MSPNPALLTWPRTAVGGDPLGAFSWTWRFESDSLTGLSDGDPVNTWPDTSGNGRNATASGGSPTLDADAFGSVAGVLFGPPSTTPRLVTGSISAISQPSTIWLVMTASSSAPSTFIDGIISTNRHVVYRSTSGPRAFAGAVGVLASNLDSAGIHLVRFHGSSSYYWHNGVPTAGPVSVGSHTLTGLTIGNRFTNNEGADRAYGAVLVHNGLHGTADANTIGSHLAVKYGYTWTDIT